MESQYTATMSTNTATGLEPLWSKPITAPPLQFLLPGEIHVSDEGDFFITINYHKDRELVLHRNKKDDLVLKPPRDGYSYFQSLPQWLYRFDRIDGERVAAFWIRDENDWIARKISDGSTIPVSQEIKRKWTQQTRCEILDILERGRQADLALNIKRLPEPILRLAQKSLPSAQYGELNEIHYEFLTLLQNPSDRQWIELLLAPRKFDERRFSDIYSMSPSFINWDKDPNYCEVEQQERLIGDWLLSVWDHKIKKGGPYTLNRETRQASIRAPKYLIGRIEGIARLPTPFTPFSQAGDAVRFVLLPAGISHPMESDLTERENFRGNYYQTKKQVPKPVLEIPFAFHTMLPGEYQLKVIWDKRSPFTDTNSAGPGDYESKLSAPFKIVAGQTITNFIVECTNRVSGGENYYKADEVRLKLMRSANAP
jgi:hypothetical protein